uniref:ATP synthase subunit b, chloroplastic n=1 Tax=Codium arabicum TaxID=221038 RepID=A0A386B0I1_CODAR|nr:ATP synthase CF0 subunit I [Codium arabicum]AYC65206.1 ATP synthase CF0 subunit I [Codium arabicum]
MFLDQNFGLNTSILDTNVLNLALSFIVFAIIISFVGDTLKSILQTRKQTILFNLQEAENREMEAKQKLLFAQKAFQNAQQKVLTIHANSLQTIAHEEQTLQKNTQEEIDRLYKVKQEIILFYKQKLVKEILKHVIDAAFEKVYQILEKNYTLEFQKEIIDAYIVLFCDYQN